MTHFVSIRFLFPIALLAVATAATAGPSTDEAFENLADEYISDLVNFSPVQATLVGDHSADDRLDDVDAASRAQSRELLHEYIEALQEFDLDQLTRANNEMYDVAKQQLQQAIDFVIERNIVTVPDLPCRNNHHAGLHQKPTLRRIGSYLADNRVFRDEERATILIAALIIKQRRTDVRRCTLMPPAVAISQTTLSVSNHPTHP